MSDGRRRGALELITAAHVVSAARLVTTGEVISLNHPLSYSPSAGRPSMRRTTRLLNERRPLDADRTVIVNDDAIEMALQGASHLDGFAHVGMQEAGSDAVFFGGYGLSEIDPAGGSVTLGVSVFQPGIVTRGVCLDLVRLTDTAGAGFVPADLQAGPDLVQRALEAAGLTLRSGDAVLLYTGYETMMRAHGGTFPGSCGGLSASSMPVWDRAGVSLIASDNRGIEAYPPDYGIHIGALRDRGIVLGELWNLEELVRRCHAMSRYEFLLVSVPLDVPGAFGTPSNAVAIFLPAGAGGTSTQW
jgi:hypothetical protein